MKLRSYYMAVFAMMLAACSNHPGEADRFVQPQDEQTAPASENKKDPEQENNRIGALDSTGAGQPQQKKSPVVTGSNADWDKKIIKTADMDLQLDDYKKFNSSIHATINKFGAYVAAEKQTENDFRIENTLTIKVPVAQFDDLINSFTGDGIKVMEKNISSEDVTGEVVDTKSRLQAKMAVRERYLELLKQAKNMNDILQVQNEINAIQENIEAANGRIGYLQHASAYSTVNLHYYQYINGRTADDAKPDFFTKLTRAFRTGTSLILDLLLFCISIWPLLITALLAWFYFKRLHIRKV